MLVLGYENSDIILGYQISDIRLILIFEYANFFKNLIFIHRDIALKMLFRMSCETQLSYSAVFRSAKD
jgi:hypothetical protein